ncbi:hypothetical protein EVA_19337 [gut metagenome]|uniref:Uncharacterized protein n=1 Tax=gut metagenome TaxID=749906 RepID=J9FCG3_9ZZZZ
MEHRNIGTGNSFPRSIWRPPSHHWPAEWHSIGALCEVPVQRHRSTSGYVYSSHETLGFEMDIISQLRKHFLIKADVNLCWCLLNPCY